MLVCDSVETFKRQVENLQNQQGTKRRAIKVKFLKETTGDNDVKMKAVSPKRINISNISEDEDYNMTDYGSGEEDPIKTTLAFCVKAEVEEISEEDYNYQEENSDEDEEFMEKPKKSKPRKYRTRQTRSSKGSDKDFWRSLSKSGKVKKPKRFKCNQICKQNCNTKIDKQWRQDLCTQFWRLNRSERKNYISKYVEKRPVLRLRTNYSSRGFSNVYFLQNRENEKVRVCVGFFVSTFSISGYFIKRAVDSINSKYDCIEQENSSELHEKTDHCQEQITAKDQTNEDIEKQKEMIEKINSLEYPRNTTNTDVEIPKEVNGPIAVAEDLKLSEQSRPPKPRSSTKGRTVKKERLPKPVKCDEICTMKCTSHFSEEQRVQICATYWSMDYKRRKDFLLSRIETRDVLTTKNEEYRKTKRAKRKISNRFYFRGSRGENVRVCLNFFMGTLNVGRHSIDDAIKNADPNTGSYAGEDKRGKHTPGNKIPEDMLLGVKHHIESYPTWVPHKKYKTRFLNSSLNIQKMYREYKQTCIDQQQKFVNSAYYRVVFHKHYRLAFLKPTTEHAPKASLKKKNKDGDALTFKTLNPNISDFTGEEGGFWIPAESTVVAIEQENQQQTLPRLAYSQINAATYDVNRFNIQQNLQLHPPQCVQQTPFLNAVNAIQRSSSTNYMQQQIEKQEPQQNDSQNVISSYTNAAYVHDSSVFRIL